jgi:hypothetical protein
LKQFVCAASKFSDSCSISVGYDSLKSISSTERHIKGTCGKSSRGLGRQCWFRWPFTVADDFDRYLSTARSVNQGSDVKLPFLIAAIHVDFTGLEHAACR